MLTWAYVFALLSVDFCLIYSLVKLSVKLREILETLWSLEARLAIFTGRRDLFDPSPKRQAHENGKIRR